VKRIAIFIFIMVLVISAVSLTGCESSSVSRVVVGNSMISEIDILSKAEQPKSIENGKNVYANIYFIESPSGTEYTVRWIRDGAVVKEETKKMVTDKKGILNYLLEPEYAQRGGYILEVYHKGKKIYEHKFTID
jgi:hypothetical protein